MSDIIEWTRKNKEGKTVALYRPIDLPADLQKEKDAWLAAAKKANDMRDALNAKIEAALANTAYGKAVPAGHELVVAHQFGTAFAALPIKGKAAKKNSVSLAA